MEAVLQLIGCETEPREAAALLGVVPGVPEAPADILCRMQLDVPQLALLGGALNPDGQLVVAMEAVPPSWSLLVVEGQQLPSLLVLADTQEAMFFQRTGVVLADQGHMRFRAESGENLCSGCPVLGRYEVAGCCLADRLAPSTAASALPLRGGEFVTGPTWRG